MFSVKVKTSVLRAGLEEIAINGTSEVETGPTLMGRSSRVVFGSPALVGALQGVCLD